MIFILLFLSAAVTLLAVLWHTLRGRFARARRILLRLLAATAAYMAVVAGVSLVMPRRTFQVGAPQCFDDWCIAVTGSTRSPQTAGTAYTVDVRLFSRARRVSQRENNLSVYLTDSLGRRFNPVPGAPAAPMNVLLAPGASVTVSRSFLLPNDASDVEVVITHEGGFPFGWFIVVNDTWFRKPPVARLSAVSVLSASIPVYPQRIRVMPASPGSKQNSKSCFLSVSARIQHQGGKTDRH